VNWWLRRETVARSCEHGNELLGSIYLLGISCTAEQSQEAERLILTNTLR
jgi:hypothetical protein